MNNHSIPEDKSVNPYLATRQLYLEDILPTLASHLNKDGQVVDVDGVPIRHKQKDENPYYGGLLIFYDGERLLNRVSQILTREQKVLNYEGIDSIVEFKNHIRENGYGDIVRFYDSHGGRMASARGAVTNRYDDVNETKVIRYGLPDDFKSIDWYCSDDRSELKSKHDIGTRTAAALVTTVGANKNVDPEHRVKAVLLTESEYGVGGKVVHLDNGRLTYECFARYNDGVVEFVDREYGFNETGVYLKAENATPFMTVKKNMWQRGLEAMQKLYRRNDNKVACINPTY